MLPLSVPIPDRMARLPRDRRGFPIPVTVHRDADGRPHFQVNEEAARQRVIAQDRCPICGEKLLRGRWLIGGPASALHAHGAYIDPPMHNECAHFALKVCPYLGAPSYSKLIGMKSLPKDQQNGLIETDESMMPDRPGIFVVIMVTGQRIVPGTIAGIGIEVARYIKPRRPFSRVEYWRQGVEISAAQAAPFIAESLALARAREAEIEPV